MISDMSVFVFGVHPISLNVHKIGRLSCINAQNLIALTLGRLSLNHFDIKADAICFATRKGRIAFRPCLSITVYGICLTLLHIPATIRKPIAAS